MKYSSKEIQEIISTELISKPLVINDIESVDYDTRKIFDGSKSLFVAFKGQNSNGHNYLKQAYEKGVRNFIVTDKLDSSKYPQANFFKVKNSYHAIQELAKFHRNRYEIRVVGITGSNGKTVVKEWLSSCLSSSYKIVKSPVSFNSQLGVALSLLQIENHHEIAIIEAGISQPDEMALLEKMIQPNLGILTNIGDAHDVGFKNRIQKTNEKLKLFTNCDDLIYQNDKGFIQEGLKVQSANFNHIDWGETDASINFEIEKKASHTVLKSSGKYDSIFRIPMRDDASIENICNVIVALFYFNLNQNEIQGRIMELNNIPMRLELKAGINNCLLIDDSYSFDFESLKNSIKQLESNAFNRYKTLIISDLDKQNARKGTYQSILQLLSKIKLHKLIVIGSTLANLLKDSPLTYPIISYSSTEEFYKNDLFNLFQDEVILIKGARSFGLEKISKSLAQIQNRTILEIDLFALAQNLQYFRSKLKSTTKIIAVLKASAYGSGSEQLKSTINEGPVDMLAVAVAEEAITFRESGIQKPILIFNPQRDNLSILEKYDLEIELSNFNFLKHLVDFVASSETKVKVHLKLDTGMNRLGFTEEDLPNLLNIISKAKLVIQSIFSHLVASDDPAEDTFTKMQIKKFETMACTIEKALKYEIPKHILNSGGALRFEMAQYDFVRIGLGLYGMDLSLAHSKHLTKVHSLKSHLVQIKKVKSGETVGYGNKWKLKKDALIAIVGIGYADGLLRSLGNESYAVEIQGQLAKIIGSVCMDLCMVDITGLKGVSEGDEVTIFGKNMPIEEMATAASTIPYEILTRVAPRVKRVYIQ